MQTVMEKTREDQFREQAKNELQNRIQQTEQICNQFRKSYSGYSSITGQIIFIIFLGFIIGACAFIAVNARVILSFLETQNQSRDLPLIKAALTGVSLYIALHILKLIIRISKIAKIDSFVAKVRDIAKDLRRALDNMGIIAGEAARIISGGKNEKLKSVSSVDSDIKKYSGLAGTYTDDSRALNAALTIVHWLSGILFTGVLLIISVPFLTGRFGSPFIGGGHNIIVLLYTAFVLSLFMFIQELFAKGNSEKLHAQCKNIAGIVFIAGFSGLVLFRLLFWADSDFRYEVVLRVSLTANALKITLLCIPLVIGAFFSSLISYINEYESSGKVINLVYIGCITLTAVLFLRVLFLFPSENYGNFWQVFLALCLPLAATALFSTGIAIMGGAEGKVFLSVPIGGALYVIAVICILSLKYTAGVVFYSQFISAGVGAVVVIKFVLLAAIVVGVLMAQETVVTVAGIILGALIWNFDIIAMIIMAIPAFALAVGIPLAPALLVLLIASRVEDQMSKNTVVIMTAFVSVIILGLAYAQFDTPLGSPGEKYTAVYVTSDGLNVREGPSADSDTVTPSPLLYGTMIQLIEGFEEGGWIKIKYNDVEGWVNSAHTAPEPPPKR